MIVHKCRIMSLQTRILRQDDYSFSPNGQQAAAAPRASPVGSGKATALPDFPFGLCQRSGCRPVCNPLRDCLSSTGRHWRIGTIAETRSLYLIAKTVYPLWYRCFYYNSRLMSPASMAAVILVFQWGIQSPTETLRGDAPYWICIG